MWWLVILHDSLFAGDTRYTPSSRRVVSSCHDGRQYRSHRQYSPDCCQWRWQHRRRSSSSSDPHLQLLCCECLRGWLGLAKPPLRVRQLRDYPCTGSGEWVVICVERASGHAPVYSGGSTDVPYKRAMDADARCSGVGGPVSRCLGLCGCVSRQQESERKSDLRSAGENAMAQNEVRCEFCLFAVN